MQIKTDSRLPYRFRLFNAAGKLVLQNEVKGDAVLPLPKLAVGAYLYEVVSEVGRTRGKLVVR